ncbi:MAG TPA: hypothetical protein VI844_02745, partial [Coxiellaceae bacterium]|nr:hypothetical protein [Coxiellaceae bacterium]
EHPHGKAHVCDFLLTWHDFYHWHLISDTYKPAIRHVRNLLTHRGICHERDFITSHAIFLLSDGEFPSGARSLLRIKTTHGERLEPYARRFFTELLNTADAGDASQDLFLLFFIDMVRNKRVWDSFVTELLDGSCQMSALFSEPRGHPLQMAYADKTLTSTIETHQDKPTESIILRCKLRLLPNSNVLCDLADEIGLQKLFVCAMNSGLQTTKLFSVIIKENFGVDKITLDHLSSPEQLAIVLMLAVHTFGNDAQKDKLKQYTDLNQLYENRKTTIEKNKACGVDTVKALFSNKNEDALIALARETEDAATLNAIAQHAKCTIAIAKAVLLNRKTMLSNAAFQHIHTYFGLYPGVSVLIKQHLNERILIDRTTRYELLRIAQCSCETLHLNIIAEREDIDAELLLALLRNKAANNETLAVFRANPEVTQKTLQTVLQKPNGFDVYGRLSLHRNFSKESLPSDMRLFADVLDLLRDVKNEHPITAESFRDLFGTGPRAEKQNTVDKIMQDVVSLISLSNINESKKKINDYLSGVSKHWNWLNARVDACLLRMEWRTRFPKI